MEFYNLVLFVELVVLFTIIAPMYYRIPHNFNQSDLFLDIRNRQGLAIISVLCYRTIDFLLIKAGDTTRINAGTCMHSEMLTLLVISWSLWLEIVLLTSTGAANSVKYIKQQILCFICPFLLMAPCMFYKMFEYTPTTYRVMCTFKTPTDAESNQIGMSSSVMLLLALWLPAHTLLVMSYKRNKLNMLTLVMGLVCFSLYIPELMHLMDSSSTVSMDASTSRSFILFTLCVYLNSSLAGKLEKDVV